MGDEVEASAERVRYQLRRPQHPQRQLTDTEVGSTANRTRSLAAREIAAFCSQSSAAA